MTMEPAGAFSPAALAALPLSGPPSWIDGITPALASFLLALLLWTSLKNAATPQKSVCFSVANGWLWHSQHSSLTPRNRCEAAAVILFGSGCLSLSIPTLASQKTVAGFLSRGPSAVRISVTILFQPSFLLNRSA